MGPRRPSLESKRLLTDSRMFPLIALAILALVAPIVLPEFIVRLLILTLYYALLSEGWNLVAGYAGLVSLGNVVFLGIGAYSSFLLFLSMGISPFIGLIVGALISATVSVGFGLLTIRLKGLFFAIGSIGLMFVAQIISTNVKFTGGALGLIIPIKNSPLDFVFVSAVPYYYIILAMVVITILGLRFLLKTKWGFHVRALGDNEAAAQAMGVNTFKIRIQVFMLAAVITSVAGTFYAQYIGYIDPNSLFSFDTTITMILISAVGGMATIWGPLLGAFLLIPLNQFLLVVFGAAFGSLDVAIFSAMLILIMLRFPGGLMSIPGFKRKSTRPSLALPPHTTRGYPGSPDSALRLEVRHWGSHLAIHDEI